MDNSNWINAGPVAALKLKEINTVMDGETPIALVYSGGAFSAVSGECNHAKGPLCKGRLEDGYIVCPWHGWRYHGKTGHAHKPYDSICLPRHEVKVKDGRVYVSRKALNKRVLASHPASPLARPAGKRKSGPLRIAGISTTCMDTGYRPRYSTSEDLLQKALGHAKASLKAETRLIKLRDMKFNHCGGFYSIDEKACTWPCTYTQMDEEDQMVVVYESLIFWADIILVATPIRWGSASSLYYKMAERLNCIENQSLVAGNALIKNKVAAFIITGGQDNIQAVAGNMMMFFSELGFEFPPYPFMGHSRGWSAEDMANNVGQVRNDKKLEQSARGLVERAAAKSKELLGGRR